MIRLHEHAGSPSSMQWAGGTTLSWPTTRMYFLSYVCWAQCVRLSVYGCRRLGVDYVTTSAMQCPHKIQKTKRKSKISGKSKPPCSIMLGMLCIGLWTDPS